MWCWDRLKGCGSLIRSWGQEEGQAEVEVALTLLFFLATILVFVELVWLWWGQLTAAVALHDGVAAAGRTGDVYAGQGEMRRLVYAALDERRADALVDNAVLQVSGWQRMVSGRIDVPWPPLLFPLPSDMRPRIRATSIQRLEGFYPGQPPYYPWE